MGEHAGALLGVQLLQDLRLGQGEHGVCCNAVNEVILPTLQLYPGGGSVRVNPQSFM